MEPIANYSVSQALKLSSPSVPESKYGDLVNSVSALRTILGGSGLFLGPIIGGLLTKYINFQHMTEIYFVIFIVFAFIEIAIILHQQKVHFHTQGRNF